MCTDLFIVLHALDPVKLKSHDLTLHLSTCVQGQYVFTEIVLDPQFVCEQVRLCNQQEDEFQTPLLSDADSHRVTEESVRSINRHTSSPKPSSTRDPRSGSQQITFVQISDIHLDHQYAEVNVLHYGASSFVVQ